MEHLAAVGVPPKQQLDHLNKEYEPWGSTSKFRQTRPIAPSVSMPTSSGGNLRRRKAHRSNTGASKPAKAAAVFSGVPRPLHHPIAEPTRMFVHSRPPASTGWPTPFKNMAAQLRFRSSRCPASAGRATFSIPKETRSGFFNRMQRPADPQTVPAPPLAKQRAFVERQVERGWKMH